MFYEKFISLCTAKGVAPSRVALDLGMSKSSVSHWKKSDNGITNANLKRIADYFNVPVTYFSADYINPELSDRDFFKAKIDKLTNEEFEKVLQLTKIALLEKFDK